MEYMPTEYYVVRFVMADCSPDQEFYYRTRAEAEEHMNMFENDDSGLYAWVELLRWPNGQEPELLRTMRFDTRKVGIKMSRLTRTSENSTIQQMRVKLVTMLNNLDDDTLVDVAGCAGQAEGDQSVVVVNMDNYLNDLYENTCDGLRDFAQKVQGFNVDDDYLVRDNGDVTTFADLHALADYLRERSLKVAAMVMNNWGDDAVLRDALPDDILALLGGNA